LPFKADAQVGRLHGVSQRGFISSFEFGRLAIAEDVFGIGFEAIGFSLSGTTRKWCVLRNSFLWGVGNMENSPTRGGRVGEGSIQISKERSGRGEDSGRVMCTQLYYMAGAAARGVFGPGGKLRDERRATEAENGVSDGAVPKQESGKPGAIFSYVSPELFAPELYQSGASGCVLRVFRARAECGGERSSRGDSIHIYRYCVKTENGPRPAADRVRHGVPDLLFMSRHQPEAQARDSRDWQRSPLAGASG
jgi:hypothetical protein